MTDLGFIQAFIVILVTCKNEEDPVKNEGAVVLTTFSHSISVGIFTVSQLQLPPQLWSDRAECLTHSLVHETTPYLQERRRSNQNRGR